MLPYIAYMDPMGLGRHNYLKHQGACSLFKPTEINGQHGVTPHVFTAVNRIQMAPDIQRSSQPMVMEHVDGKSSTTCTFFKSCQIVGPGLSDHRIKTGQIIIIH